MAELIAAQAWCNNEVAYIAWRSDEPIPDCLGFAITRILEDGSRRSLPTWVAFRGQSNPDWEPQDTTVWPVQKYVWRDLTLRRSRDSLLVRDDGFRVSYEIAALGRLAPGLTPVPQSPQAADYVGDPIPLAFLGPIITTDEIEVGIRRGQISVAFNNGILSTQNLRKQLGTADGEAPSKAELIRRIGEADNATRRYLAGDILPLFQELFRRAEAEDGTIHAALYELHDAELLDLLLTHHERLHLILSTAGSSRSKPTQWDTTNAAARAALREALGDRLQDRMFNTSAHIGHNKFAVLSVDGSNKAVWTGSTNWTSTGLCGQTNNAILVEDEEFATHYRDYWDRLWADPQPVPVPISAPHRADQGPSLRAANATPRSLTIDGGASQVELWFSPNTPKTGSSDNRTVPPDLEVVFQHMKAAKKAIFFLVFNPGRTAEVEDDAGDINTVVSAALAFARHQPGLLVKGAISDPTAVPGYEAPRKGAPKPKPEDRIPNRAIFSPPGAPNILMVRASAITDIVGDFEKELLTAGTAIIHDKVVVIDPLDEDECVVITGSHNLGFKASYANDENMVIVKGNAKLAQAYAVHVLDVFEHFRFRAALVERERDEILARLRGEAEAEMGGHPAPETESPTTGRGFLSTDGNWQQQYFSGPKARELDYFLGE